MLVHDLMQEGIHLLDRSELAALEQAPHGGHLLFHQPPIGERWQ
jgi:hypothetical protein